MFKERRYSDQASGGYLDTFVLPQSIHIRMIQVPNEFRGRGIASGLLKQLLNEADSEGKQVSLIVISPGMLTHSPGELDTQTLINWFSRYGFVQHLSYPRYMIRQPLDNKA